MSESKPSDLDCRNNILIARSTDKVASLIIREVMRQILFLRAMRCVGWMQRNILIWFVLEKCACVTK